MATVTILVENTARGAGILGEHGLAWWIDTGAHRVLFDTGQGLALRPNCAALDVDLARTDAIVLSHGHYDHVGGLEPVLALAPHASLWLHPRATEPKFAGPEVDGFGRRVSVDFVEREKFRVPGRRVVATAEPREVVPGVWMTGEIPRANDFEDTGGPFFLDAALTEPDPLRDDQAMFFPTEAGVVVVLGCAHAGVINTLAHVTSLTGARRIHAVIGGMHLGHASPHRLAQTLAGLQHFGVQHVAPLHCTGMRAVIALANAFGDRCEHRSAGDRMTFSGQTSASGVAAVA